MNHCLHFGGELVHSARFRSNILDQFLNKSVPGLPHADKTDKKKEKWYPEVSTVVYMFPNGDRYEGECIRMDDDSVERTGNGRHITDAGIIYEGSWDRDKMSGHGKLVHPSGASYEGEFLNNQFHGHGTYIWPDGSRYSGQFVDNRLQGEGVFTDTEGQAWTGMFHYKAALGLKFKLNIN